MKDSQSANRPKNKPNPHQKESHKPSDSTSKSIRKYTYYSSPSIPSLKKIVSYIQKNSFFQNSWLVLPVVSLLIVLLALAIYNSSLEKEIVELAILPKNPVKISSYPLFVQQLIPDITAESAFIIDRESKVVLYKKNPTLRLSMASTTKIMTALVALEHFHEQDMLTIYNAYTEGAVVGFPVGEKVYFKDILYGLLLPSGNDAAYAIAENYPGGTEAFVKRMNEKTNELHLPYTHYVDPAGLDDDGNYTTALDLARLALYAIKNPTLAKVIATQRMTIRNVDGTNFYTLSNLNKLLGQNGVTGVKTGFTEGAGEVLVTSKEEKGRTFIIVVMKSQDRFGDTRKLLNLISDNITFIKPDDYIMESGVRLKIKN